MSTQSLSILSKISGRIPLRVIIVIPFVLLVSIAGGLTGYLSYRNGQDAVNNVASQLRTEVTARIEERVHNYLETAHLLNALHRNAFKLGQLDVQNSQEMEHYFWQQIQSFKEVTSTFFGAEQSSGFAGARQGKLYPEVILSREGNLEYYATDPQGNRTDQIVDKAANYDHRQRGWYQVARDKKQPIWSEIYPEFATKSLAITAAQPVYDPTDTLLGVVGTTAYFNHVNEFLNKLKIGQTGQTFIMERSGLLVATSTLDPVVHQIEVSGTKKVQRLKATESGSKITKATAQHLEQHFGNLDKIMDSQQLDFDIEAGVKQFVQVKPLKDARGLDWLVVVTIPEADFMQQIDANTRTTMMLSLVALVLTALIGLLTARWIIRPILRLNTATQKFSQGNWDEKLPTERTDELGELARSFNSMGEQVKQSFHALEEANASLELRVQERTKELSQALTELKASQAQLIQSEKMASLGQMVAGVAHEINTPLGYVRSNVEMTRSLFSETENLVNEYDRLVGLLTSEEVSEDDLNEQLATVAEISETFREDDTFNETQALYKDVLFGLDQISDLVVNLKDFSRMDQARVDNINLNESLDSVLIIGHNVIKDAVVIEKQYGDIPKIQCSPSHINQVLLNLVTNAAQAMEGKRGKVIIRTTADDEKVYVDIEDNGKGIPPDIIEKIFDPFFTTKPVGEGTGLGLSITYQIVEQHHGQIKVASEVGKGTKFTVILPRQQPSS